MEEVREGFEFEVKKQPVVVGGEDAGDTVPERGANVDELPRSYESAPLVVVLARDPRTLFAYWDVDWAGVFGEATPRERPICLRVINNDGTEESSITVEPLAGSAYVEVARADAGYRCELGYRGNDGEWTVVATSEPAITPRDSVVESSEFDLVTVPLHLNFQRLLDMFRGSRYDGHALSESISRLQTAVETNAPETAEIAANPVIQEAVRWLFSEPEVRARNEFREAATAAASGRIAPRKLERILGFGATSPAGDLGGGS